MSALDAALQLNCQECDNHYEAYHAKSRYCSDRCKMRAYRKRKAHDKKMIDVSGSTNTHMSSRHYEMAKTLDCHSRNARALITRMQYTYGGKVAEEALEIVMAALRETHVI